MKKILATLCCALLVSAFCVSGAVAKDKGGFQGAGAGGGFSGPGLATVTVEEAKSMRDDAHVVLRGNITRHLGKDKYQFRDASGTITVEIDHDKWGGQTISPADTVELQGEVDKDWNSVEIDVDKVIKVQ